MIKVLFTCFTLLILILPLLCFAVNAERKAEICHLAPLVVSSVRCRMLEMQTAVSMYCAVYEHDLQRAEVKDGGWWKLPCFSAARVCVSCVSLHGCVIQQHNEVFMALMLRTSKQNTVTWPTL